MSNQNLEQVVRDSLEGYFRDLEGETPANVYDMVIRLVEKPLLEVVMGQADNNQSRAAEWLGLNRNTLRKSWSITSCSERRSYRIHSCKRLIYLHLQLVYPNFELTPMKALISVSDKTGIVEFAQALHALGVQLLSTGGTAKLLAGGPARDRSGRSHRLPRDAGRPRQDPAPQGARRPAGSPRLPEHMAALKEHGIETIDLLVVNLYPFEATVAKAGCTLADAIENIDIGGPAMVRSAAKNWKDVGVLTAADQYEAVLAELKARQAVRQAALCAVGGRVQPHRPVRRRHQRLPVGQVRRRKAQRRIRARARPVPGQSNGHFVKVQDLRYGENSTSRPLLPRPVPRTRLAGHACSCRARS
jgi:DNA-binding protein Fis